MAFPRKAAAGTWYEGRNLGVNQLGVGVSGLWEAEVNVNGFVQSIELLEKPGKLTIDDLRIAINRGMLNALHGLHVHWSDYGMDLGQAIETVPYLKPDQELKAELQSYGFHSEGRCDFTVNAEPQITSLKATDIGIENIAKAISLALHSALKLRQKLVSRMTDGSPLKHDVASFQWLEHDLKQNIQAVDEDRLTILMPVGRGGNHHFINSATRIVEQANDIGKKVDLLLGLNHVDYPEEVNGLRSQNTDIVNLYLNEEESTGIQPNIPLLLTEDVYESPDLTGEKYVIGKSDPKRNRIFAIRQEQTPWNKGKNPLQRVLVRMLDDSVRHGNGAIPKDMLLMDADSWLVQHSAGRRPQNFDLGSNGLGSLLAEKESLGLEMIGAHCQSAKFEQTRNGDKVPNFDRPLTKLYQLLDASSPYLKFMPGGATLGDFPTVLAALAIIAHRYPGSRSEDMHTSIIADAAGVKWDLAKNTSVSNEVREENLDQAKRWFSGAQGLLKLYKGQNAFKGIMKPNSFRSAFGGPEWKEAMDQYEYLIEYSKQHPDDIRTGDASWNA